MIITEDGSHTIYLPEMNENYHSVHGAISESLHVYIRSGFSYHPARKVSILEIGFGTGLNVLLTLLQAREEKREVIYHSVDTYILPADVTDNLNYGSFYNLFSGGTDPNWFKMIHESSWDKEHQITGFFLLKKSQADVKKIELTHKYDIVFFDAFGPDKQPDMWTDYIFRKIFNAMNPGSIMTTYSSKGEVRRKLEKSGFMVTRIPGPAGKREMLRCFRKE